MLFIVAKMYCCFVTSDTERFENYLTTKVDISPVFIEKPHKQLASNSTSQVRRDYVSVSVCLE